MDEKMNFYKWEYQFGLKNATDGKIQILGLIQRFDESKKRRKRIEPLPSSPC